MTFIDDNSEQEEPQEEVNKKLEFNTEINEVKQKQQRLYMQFDIENASLKEEIFSI